ncbi:hypothetical protein [Paraburkholderia tagetis]|uniref:Uncharacterized protein n=1 Tax=Paraburkholderia tagetis TaxID=2913261 RepID=A0A9X1RTG5_9BURK|nr:hypothetical protein [Paraburkholderia tagetis]MCG5076550.1 hypothetical protein [Paraburkholderia tagetis]
MRARTGSNRQYNLHSLIDACKVIGVESYRYLITSCSALPLTTIADNEALVPWPLDLP